MSLILPSKADELADLTAQLRQASVPFLASSNADRRRGLPDIVVIAPPAAVWLRRRELAADLSQSQSATYDYLRQCGWRVILAFGATEAFAQILAHWRSSHGFNP